MPAHNERFCKNRAVARRQVQWKPRLCKVFNMKYRIYMDNCCFHRPYDDQNNLEMIRDPIDYTEWQRDLFNDVPLDDFLKMLWILD